LQLTRDIRISRLDCARLASTYGLAAGGVRLWARIWHKIDLGKKSKLIEDTDRQTDRERDRERQPERERES
jgi:hypothetical protein